MFLIEHRALHLTKYEAYKEYCYSVDQFDSYQPTSFIYLSFDSFRELCQEYGLLLESNLQSKNISWGIITRIESNEDEELIRNALRAGKNVIALFPLELVNLYYNGDQDRFNNARKIMKLLLIPDNSQVLNIDSAYSDEICWDEIETAENGRLFFTNDIWLSDGYFIDGCGKSDKNTVKINQLIKEFSTFKYELLRIQIRDILTTWPCHEPISFIVDITNHGPDLIDLPLSVELSNGFEPLSPLERHISHLKTNQTVSFAFQAVPRIDGKYIDPFRIIANSSDMASTIKFDQNKYLINVLPSYGSSFRSSAKTDNMFLTILLSSVEKTSLFRELSNLPNLLQVDAAACLNRIRSTGEKLSNIVVEKHGILNIRKNFNETISIIQSQKLLSQCSVGYLNTIRIIGNLASHPSREHLTETDVRIASYALASVVNEALNKGLLEKQ